jgi:hypothetical protein
MPRGASKNSNALFEIVVLPMDRRSTIVRHRLSLNRALGGNLSLIETDESYNRHLHRRTQIVTALNTRCRRVARRALIFLH